MSPWSSSLVAQRVKNLPAMWETWVRSLGQEDPLEKGMATHSSILAGRIPRTEEPGGLWSMGLQRIRHDWATKHSSSSCLHTGYIFCLEYSSPLQVHLGKSSWIYFKSFSGTFSKLLGNEELHLLAFVISSISFCLRSHLIGGVRRRGGVSLLVCLLYKIRSYLRARVFFIIIYLCASILSNVPGE